jgi:hypothetical protein
MENEDGDYLGTVQVTGKRSITICMDKDVEIDFCEEATNEDD